MVIIRIHLPRIRIWFKALDDWLPPETSITVSVLLCVGRTDPTANIVKRLKPIS